MAAGRAEGEVPPGPPARCRRYTPGAGATLRSSTDRLVVTDSLWLLQFWVR